MLANKKSRKQQESNREMRLYLKEISRIPLLTVEEEKELGRRARNGDKDAIRKMIESNLRFVIKISKKYRGLGLSFLDLINEGNLGLMEAARRFDPERNVRFTSYAVWWIRQAILHALTNVGHTLRLPAKVSNTLYKVGKSVTRKTSELKRKPTIQEIADDIGMPANELSSMMEVAADATSLDQPINENEEMRLEDLLEDDSGQSVEQLVARQFLKEHIQESLGELEENERKILTLRFGLDDDVPHTLKEIGETMGLSRERIRQIEAKALDKLRHNRKTNTLSSYLN